MEKIAILIDSTSTFDQNEIDKKGIHLIYNSVNDDDGNIIDDICSNEQKRQLCELITNEHRPIKTSSINSQLLQEKFLELQKKYDKVVYLTLAPSFSSQYNNAILAKAAIGSKDVIVLHSQSVAAQTEIILEWLLDYVKTHKEFNQELMQKEIAEVAKHITTILTTFHLEGLITSGRIPTSVAKLLKLAKMFPLIQGEETHKKAGLYRKWSESAKNVFEAIDNRFPEPPRAKHIKEIILCHTLCDDARIKELTEKICEYFQVEESIIKVRVTPLLVATACLKDSFGVTIYTTGDLIKKC